MSYEPNEFEVRNVLRLPGDQRYGYLLTKAVDWLELWSCRDDNGWALGSHDGRETIPVWPARAYAELCLTGAWAGAQAQSISLGDWVEKWLPGMIRDDRLVAIFPTPDGKTTVVGPRAFHADIQDQLRRS